MDGYLYLFFLSFLAATVVPVGSEWLLVAMLAQAKDPSLLLLAATSGNVLGACTTYCIGRYGGDFFTQKVLRIGREAKLKAEERYRRYGVWSLLLSWLPVIGDPLCLAGGLFRTRFTVFLLLVFVGKLGRYACIEAVALHALG